MNNKRRDEIGKIRVLLDEANSLTSELRSEEEDYRDNMPESFEEKREAADNAIDAFESAEAALEEALGYLETAAE